MGNGFQTGLIKRDKKGNYTIPQTVPSLYSHKAHQQAKGCDCAMQSYSISHAHVEVVKSHKESGYKQHFL